MSSWLRRPTVSPHIWPVAAYAKVNASWYGCRAGSRPRLRCSRVRGIPMSAARHCTATRVAEIVALAERVRAAALIALPGYGADSDRLDVFAELAGQQALRF